VTAIESAFRRLRAEERKGLVVYLTAGDPTPAVSLSYLRAVADAGADIIEVGVPFSDPTADGPAIEAAARRALSAGMNVGRCLELVCAFRKSHQTPVVLFGYYNPFFRYGISRLSADARSSGVDGLLAVDLPLEEAEEAAPAIRSAGLDWIPLVAPTTGARRARAIQRAGSGFLYLISVTGVTGLRRTFPPGMAAWARGVRRTARLPVAVGFGISTPKMARAATRHAAAGVVGSACVKIVERNGRASRGPAELSRFVTSLKSAIR
jgi:tryptophan synthase alpha chain